MGIVGFPGTAEMSEPQTLSMSMREGQSWQARSRSCSNLYVGVSNNRGTPKWMVYNGKPY